MKEITLRQAAKLARVTPRYMHRLVNRQNSPFPGAHKLDPETTLSPIIIPLAEFEAWLKNWDHKRGPKPKALKAKRAQAFK